MNSIDDFEARRIKRRVWIVLISIFVVFLFGLIGGIYWLFFDYDRLSINKGEIVAEATSPDESYTVKGYISNVHATAPLCMLAELEFNKTNHAPKMIYFQQNEDKIIIYWKDNKTVVINGKELDVPDEIYDSRHE